MIPRHLHCFESGKSRHLTQIRGPAFKGAFVTSTPHALLPVARAPVALPGRLAVQPTCSCPCDCPYRACACRAPAVQATAGAG